jgi:tRNA 2-thiouridine synthesizing protein C|tara:strand:+ start:34397 stop:34768 length:372 start_codon:yes stop_codon:yes gene_type:complete
MSVTTEGGVLVVTRHPQPGRSLARAALDTALATAAFDQPVNLLFLGAGVLQLLPQQDSTSVGVRNLRKVIDSMPLYDLERCYVDADAVERFGLTAEDLPCGAVLVGREAQRSLLDSHQHILGF